MNAPLMDWTGPEATHVIVSVQLKNIIQEIKKVDCSEEARAPIVRDVGIIVDKLQAAKDRMTEAKESDAPIEDRYNDYIQVLSILEEATFEAGNLLGSLDNLQTASTQSPT
jgi:hypothetical protein